LTGVKNAPEFSGRQLGPWTRAVNSGSGNRPLEFVRYSASADEAIGICLSVSVCVSIWVSLSVSLRLYMFVVCLPIQVLTRAWLLMSSASHPTKQTSTSNRRWLMNLSMRLHTSHLTLSADSCSGGLDYSPVSVQTQSLALRSVNENRKKRKRLRLNRNRALQQCNQMKFVFSSYTVKLCSVSDPSVFTFTDRNFLDKVASPCSMAKCRIDFYFLTATFWSDP